MTLTGVDHREHAALDSPDRGEAAGEEDRCPEGEGQNSVEEQRGGVEDHTEVPTPGKVSVRKRPN